MMTVRFNIKKHLSEYLFSKFGESSDNNAISLPDTIDLYYVLFDLLSKRPKNAPVDSGNVELVLPNRRIGKKPESYNYLSNRAVRILEHRIEVMFWCEVHHLIDENKHVYGIKYIESVVYFLRKYNIESISEDALLKNYYRWRNRQGNHIFRNRVQSV